MDLLRGRLRELGDDPVAHRFLDDFRVRQIAGELFGGGDFDVRRLRISVCGGRISRLAMTLSMPGEIEGLMRVGDLRLFAGLGAFG